MYKSKYAWWILGIGFILIYLIPLGMHPLWMPDETRYAEISREMLSTGNWVVPHFMGLHYFEKPILGYWLNNLSQLIFGSNNFAARLASAVSIGVTAVILYRFVLNTIQDKRKAFYSTLVYLTCPLVFGTGTYNTLDSQLTLWISASFASFYYAMNAQTRNQQIKGYLIFGAFAGAAFLTKGFVGLALLVIAIVPFMIITRQLKQLLIYGWLALLAAVCVALPWSIAVAIKAPDYWNFFFWNENIRRFSSEHAQHLAPIWYYVPWLLLTVWPWTILAPKAIMRSLAENPQRRFFLYQACCFILPFLLLSIARGKLVTYILPLFMPLAILIGCGLAEFTKSDHRLIKISIWVNSLIGCLLALVLCLMQFGIIGRSPVYLPNELSHFGIGILVFGWWAMVPLLALKRLDKAPLYLAAAPLGLFLLFPFALPMKVVNNKHPEVFLQQYQQLIKPDAWVVTNSISLIGALGWQLHRTNIDLLNASGELEYGLNHAQHQRRYSDALFREQLPLRQQHQQVVVVLHAKPDNAAFRQLPTPAEHFNAGNFYLYIYPERP